MEECFYLIRIDIGQNPRFICDYTNEQLSLVKGILDLLNVTYEIYMKINS